MELPQSLHQFLGESSPSWSPTLRDMSSPAPQIQETYHEPNGGSEWHCVTCDSTDSVAVMGGWQCVDCGSKDFYKPPLPMKTVTSTGTWMYLPHQNAEPSSGPSSATSHSQAGGDEGEDGDLVVMTLQKDMSQTDQNNLNQNLRHTTNVWIRMNDLEFLMDLDKVLVELHSPPKGAPEAVSQRPASFGSPHAREPQQPGSSLRGEAPGLMIGTLAKGQSREFVGGQANSRPHRFGNMIATTFVPTTSTARKFAYGKFRWHHMLQNEIKH